MSKLISIKSYESSITANRDKQILAENDIESFIANEQTIQSDWLLSQAIGGLQLQVFEENVENAKEILKNFEENEEVALEVEHIIENPEYDFTCPKCGSNHIYQNEKPDGFFGISWLLLGIPVKIPSSKYTCYYCGNIFKH